jgi:hypothetical protein
MKTWKEEQENLGHGKTFKEEEEKEKRLVLPQEIRGMISTHTHSGRHPPATTLGPSIYAYPLLPLWLC